MLSRYVKYLNRVQSTMYAQQAQQPAKKYPQPQMPEIMLPNRIPENVLPDENLPDLYPEQIAPENKYPQQFESPYGHGKMPEPYLSDEIPRERTIGPVVPAQGDPPPILSDPPAVANIVLRKELTGYPNYGNPSGNADILYTGTQGVWTFDSPAFLFIPGNLRAQLVISAVLDDHRDVPPARYSATITVNGTVVHRGSLGLAHGTPAGGIFRNWRELTFNIPTLRRQNRVVIRNTSNAGPDDWIALDWMEIRFRPR